MTDSKEASKKRYTYIKRTGGGSSAGVLYCMGFVGALIYYLHFHSGTLWLVILAFVKATFWPALMTYHFLLLMHM